MGELIQAMDWSKTPLGPIDRWPQSLKTAVSIMLASKQAIWVGWGPELTYLYNDPYKAIIGGKHPHALGRPTSEVWGEIWDDIGPMLASAMSGSTGTYVEEQLLIMVRNGYPEETYYTFSYTPIPRDDGSPGGIFCANTDDTNWVLGDRQLKLLRKLSAVTADLRSSMEVCVESMHTLEDAQRDIPFALLYLAETGQSALKLVGLTGLADQHPLAVAELSPNDNQPWPLGNAQKLQKLHEFELSNEIQASLPAGIWNRPSKRAVVLPISISGEPGQSGFLIIGLNPYRLFDETYRGFLLLVASQISAAMAIATAYEDATRRADALAELDRAKTAFFSNVSHELRTPLTLILGPVEDFLERRPDDADSALFHVVHRNIMRLRKLVNTLLEFSRIEAGRLQAELEPTDLARATADIASLFRSTIEGAGITYDVDIAPLSHALRIDRDMWEKIVSNFLSNAYKYTFEGRISVRLRETRDEVILDVSDTGVGIPIDAQPQIFQRFYRAATEGRTEEGAGIGLALVKELVSLHGGEVRMQSEEGAGSTFSVVLPASRLRVPRDTEVRPWGSLPSAEAFSAYDLTPAEDLAEASHGIADSAERILVVDDNDDLRAYLGRIFSSRCKIEFAQDGEAALRAIRSNPPDLVICDVMMPKLNGLDLVKILRTEVKTSSLPFILLSARAGEEARVEGLNAGADDYLVKPFSARELIARVETQLLRARMSSLERKVSQRLQEVFDQAPVGIAVTRGPNHVFEYANPGYLALIADPNPVGKRLSEVFPELADQGVYELFDEVFTSKKPFRGMSHQLNIRHPKTGELADRFFDFVYQPLITEDGNASGIAVVVYDVDDLVLARKQAEAANRAKDEFIAMLGHELRNPLSPITTALHLLGAKYGDTASRERAIIERQVQHMVRLVDDLLDVARVAKGKVDLKKSVVELGSVLAKAIEASQPLIEQQQHRLTLDVRQSGLKIDVDPARIAQVISNLLSNAARYTPKGGNIRVSARAEDGKAVLDVVDDGRGMAAEELERVFDLFVQGNQGIDRPQGGLGLGLTIAKNLTEQHGGRLLAASDGPGLGSRFTLLLPLAPAELAPEDQNERDEIAPAGQGKRVLVVDDNLDALEMLVELLSGWGYLPSVAHDGPSALSVLESGHVDVALLDIGLPGMSGYELAAQIRQRTNQAHIKLIALSGYGQAADLRRAMESGFEEHLVKPVNLEKLADILRRSN